MARSTLGAINDLWMKNIGFAIKRKEEFDKFAIEGLKFYDGPHDWVYDLMEKTARTGIFEVPDDYKQKGSPSFKITINRVFEMVSIFGPLLYSRNPNVLVSPRDMPEFPQEIWQGDMMAAQFAMDEQLQRRSVDKTVCTLLQTQLNYMSNETGMRDPIRRMVVEALVKGASSVWPSLIQMPGSDLKTIRMRWVSIDDIVWDPDARSFQDVQWIAVRCQHPTRQVERAYGYEPGYLKGMMKSSQQRHREELDDRPKRSGECKSQTYDVMSYWKVYSKVGVGKPLEERNGDDRELSSGAISEVEELFTDNVMLAVADGLEHPINLPPAKVNVPKTEASKLELQNATSWQVPHWRDDSWPCRFLWFHTSPNSLYPIAHIKPVLGEQYYLDWVYSMILSKVRIVCRTLVGYSEDVDPVIEDIIKGGADFAGLKLPAGKKPSDLIQEFNFGTLHPDMFRSAEMSEVRFAKGSGLTPEMYGQQGERQIRSGTEAANLGQKLNIRPDDMRDQTEECVLGLFRTTALMMRYLYDGNDVRAMCGDAGAHLWEKHVKTTDVDKLILEYQYRIEGGSTRRPNHEAMLQNFQQIAQPMIQLLAQFSQHPMVGQENVQELNKFLNSINKVTGLDYTFNITAPPPPPPPPEMPQGGEGPPPEGVPPQEPMPPDGGMPPEMPPEAPMDPAMAEPPADVPVDPTMVPMEPELPPELLAALLAQQEGGPPVV